MKTNIIIDSSDENIELDLKFYENISNKIFNEVFNLVSKCDNLLEYKNYDFSFDILFVSDEEIKEINSEYRKKNTPTDVITFSLFFDSSDKTICDNTIELGEIIISVDTAIKQAKENNNPIEVEIETLITHGILHLLGFDHLTDDDYKFVCNIQKQIIEKINKVPLK